MSIIATLFVSEFVAGGGWWRVDPARPPEGSLLDEGGAMLRAIVADAVKAETRTADGVATRSLNVVTTRDARLGPGFDDSWKAALGEGLARVEIRSIASADEERRQFETLAAQTDWTLVIAPEFDGHLAARSKTVEQVGGRLLGPGSPFVALASDKQATAQRLAEAGVNVPFGVPLAASQPIPADFVRPAVLKPRYGAGSMGLLLLRRNAAADEPALAPFEARLEKFCPGESVSVAWLCGPHGAWPLPPCRQRLSDDGRFVYLGGESPLEPRLAERAVALTRAALAAMPNCCGYVGLDLVLGRDALGAEDVVIEINPRLTTSYVGLRARARTNLMWAMLDAARGEEPRISFCDTPLQFSADGRVWALETAR